MTTTPNPHVGSTFESWLDAQGIREEVTAAAIKAVLAHQLEAGGRSEPTTIVSPPPIPYIPLVTRKG